MEKIIFMIRCIVLLVAFPVIMFTEMTRKENGNKIQKLNRIEAPAIKTDEAMITSFPITQVVFN